MNVIIVYQSHTGFTEQYAKWLADTLCCSCKPLKRISGAELQDYDRVIFGGWIMGNIIMGLDKLCKMTVPYAVFAVGSTPPYNEVIEEIKKQNRIGGIPLFYMEGGFRFEQLAFPQKVLLKALRKTTSKKEKRSRQEDFLVQRLGTSFDHSGKEQITALIEYLADNK
jgi:menaquinone-dependent protoporphyrinogen IX oxidase